jgi:exonuclease VII small subunit
MSFTDKRNEEDFANLKEKAFEEIKTLIEKLESEYPKLNKAVEKLNLGEPINPKMKKIIEDFAQKIYNDGLTETIKHGLTQTKTEFLSENNSLEKKLSIAIEALEVIVSEKPNKNECFHLATQALEKISVRDWKGKR